MDLELTYMNVRMLVNLLDQLKKIFLASIFKFNIQFIFGTFTSRFKFIQLFIYILSINTPTVNNLSIFSIQASQKQKKKKMTKHDHADLFLQSFKLFIIIYQAKTMQTEINNISKFLDVSEFILINNFQSPRSTICTQHHITVKKDQTPYIQGIQITNFLTPYTLLPHPEMMHQQEFQQFCLNGQAIICSIKQISDDDQDIEDQEIDQKLKKNLLDIIQQEYENYQPTLNRQVSRQYVSSQFNNQENQLDDRDQQLKYYKFLSMKQNNIGNQLNTDYLKQTRKMKVQRYLIKKQRRNWRKKISYFCRKQVADARLRIKGRFITRDQVTKMFNINTNNLTIQEIKQLIEVKLNSKYETQTTESQFSEDFKILV